MDDHARPWRWRDDARCRGHAAVVEAAQARNPAAREAMRHMCASCPVAAQCLDEAMAQEGNEIEQARYGIRGGLDPAQRWRLAHGKAEPARTASA